MRAPSPEGLAQEGSGGHRLANRMVQFTDTREVSRGFRTFPGLGFYVCNTEQSACVAKPIPAVVEAWVLRKSLRNLGTLDKD